MAAGHRRGYGAFPLSSKTSAADSDCNLALARSATYGFVSDFTFARIPRIRSFVGMSAVHVTFCSDRRPG